MSRTWRTAVDKAASTEIKRKLFMAGAQRGSSVDDDPTLADQLRLKITFHRRIITRIKRARRNLSDKQRQAHVAVLALILTGIYQSALSPPGGVYQADKGAIISLYISTATATPESAGKSILSASDFLPLLAVNMVVLLVTTLTIFVLIPGGSSVGDQLVGPTFSFAFSYLYSMPLISPTPGIRRVGAVMMALFDDELIIIENFEEKDFAPAKT